MAIFQAWPSSKFDTRDPAGVWARALDGLTQGQMRHGIAMLSSMDRGWPPAPGEFRAECHRYRAPEPKPDPRQLHLEDDSPERIAARARMAAQLHELGRSLGHLRKPPPPMPIDNIRTRMEQAVCDHDWKTHGVAGVFCWKCGVMESELEAFRIRRVAFRNEAREAAE